MDNNKLFVVAIGGTGMRCLESFVHLCAIGMFDNKEIEVLTLDTDQNNGNKARVEALIELYNRIKSNDPTKIDGGERGKDSFFTAKINLYHFFTNYGDGRNNYKNLAKLLDGDAQDNQDLSNLFLDEDTVQAFDLSHGYRAQTHLGSMLMYNSIVETARKMQGDVNKLHEHETEFKNFLNALADAGEGARVFIFGSVFGGTGASSIPVIPVAFRDAITTMNRTDNDATGGRTIDLQKVKFGSTLLTEYFTFNRPTPDQKRNEKIVADCDFFSINSQAALQFYKKDPTVQQYYRRMYHIGWPKRDEIDPNAGKPGLTNTGGGAQKNNCHVAELLSACAAYDFFNIDDSELNNNQVKYLYRSAPVRPSGDFEFSAADFVGDLKAPEFESKLGAMFSLAHLILGKEQGAWTSTGSESLRGRLQRQKFTEYDVLTAQELKDIDDYLQQFAYKFVDGEPQLGWIYQIHESVKPGLLIFKPEAFASAPNIIGDVDFGDIYVDEKHRWPTSGLSLSARERRYNEFVNTITEKKVTPDVSASKKEMFISLLYKDIMMLQDPNKR